MKRVVLKHIPLRENRWARFSRPLPQILFTLFLVQYALVCSELWTSHRLFGEARWPDGVLVVLTAATLLASLTRSLPAQNVMLAANIIGGLGAAVHTLGAATGIPFGPLKFTSSIGQELFHPLPWAIPVLWISLVLSSRGAARLVLRPWRTTAHYGFWMMGLTTALLLALVAGLEPFATRVKQFWLWLPSRTSLFWYDAPWVNFLGWCVSTLTILAFATPTLINKMPVKNAPPDYQPLMVWTLLNLLFANGAASQKLWPAAFVCIGTTLGVLGAAIYGIRKSRLAS
jgi:uncharacterized membrane protein